MKEQKGINVIAVVIGVVIGLIIVAIGGFFILSGGEKPQTPDIVNPSQDVVQDNEIKEEEMAEIEEFLKKVAYVVIAGEHATQPEMTEEQAMIYMATYGLEKEETNNNVNTNTTTNSGINMDLTPQVQNTVGNTITNTITMQQNTLGISEDTIQDALLEMFGLQLDNLSQKLQVIPEVQDLVLPEITELEDVSKNNGIYTAVYSACPMTAEDIKNGTNIYGINSYLLQVKFEKNDTNEYSKYKFSSMSVLNRTSPIAYHISYTADTGKYGVIDNNGIVILDAKYSRVVIPNSYVGVFLCYTDEQASPTVLNEKGIQLFAEYDNIEIIQSTAGGESLWTENNILKVRKNGFYGAIDFQGNVILEPVYEEIAPLGYIVGKLVITQSGMQALADIQGNLLSNFAYSKIGLYGGDFDMRVLDETMLDTANNDYIIGQTATTGAYEIVKVEKMADMPVAMSSLAKSYNMTIGTSWQLAVLEEIIPVYVKQAVQVPIP